MNKMFEDFFSEIQTDMIYGIAIIQKTADDAEEWFQAEKERV